MEETLLNTVDALPVLEEILTRVEQLLTVNLFFLGCAGAILVIFLLYKCIKIFF